MGTFEITIPASTSNLGPGFDTLGLALNLYNRISVKRGGSVGIKIALSGSLKGSFRKNIEAMIRHTIVLFLEKTGKKKPDITMTFDNAIPIGRGLGSSATFRVGTLAALNNLFEEPLSLDDMIAISCSLEKHTENSVSSAVGGLTASGFHGDRVIYAKHPVHDKFTFVAAIPDKAVATPEMRKLLPAKVKLADAVANMNRTALLIDAIGNGKCDALPKLFEDRLHQPYRAKVITPLYEVIGKAMDAGACGGFLSGSGSTIMAMTTCNIEAIGEAMKKALHDAGWPSKVAALKPDLEGLRSSGKKKAQVIDKPDSVI